MPPELRLLDAEQAQPTDDELMILASLNHQDAFEVLVRRHQELVLGLATRFLGNPDLGRDVAQDVFLSIWAERDRYQARNKFRSYLVAVTVNRCRIVARQARSKRSKLNTLARQEEKTPSPGNEALQSLLESERRREVRAQVTRLPDAVRQVLILRFTHDLPIEEISALTGLREGTVKSHLFRGVRRLHNLLKKDKS